MSTKQPSPDAPRCLVIALRGGGTLWLATRFDNVARIDSDLQRAWVEASNPHGATMSFFKLSNADNGEPNITVNLRDVAGWYFYTPADNQEQQRVGRAVEKMADAIAKDSTDGDAWKQNS